MSRDLDSRLSDREQGAVQDWLHSNKSVHVMRDHINHDFPMVGCCWGTRLFDQNIRLKWKISWNNAINDTIMYSHHDSWGPDQIFLERCLTTSVEFFVYPIGTLKYLFQLFLCFRYVWPWAENEAIGHDSYYCLKYNTNNTKAFPTERKTGPNNFVGAPKTTQWSMETKVPCACCASESTTKRQRKHKKQKKRKKLLKYKK